MLFRSLLHFYIRRRLPFKVSTFRLQRLLIIPKALKINYLFASVEREKEGRSLMWLNMLLTGIFRLTKKLSLPTNLIPLGFIVMKLRGISMRSRFLPIFLLKSLRTTKRFLNNFETSKRAGLTNQ